MLTKTATALLGCLLGDLLAQVWADGVLGYTLTLHGTQSPPQMICSHTTPGGWWPKRSNPAGDGGLIPIRCRSQPAAVSLHPLHLPHLPVLVPDAGPMHPPTSSNIPSGRSLAPVKGADNYLFPFTFL